MKPSQPRQPFRRRVAVLMSGVVGGKLVAVLATPLLTRLFTPEQLGEYQVYLAVVAVLAAVAVLKYELAIPLPENRAVAVNLVVLGLAITIIGAIGLALLAWLVGSQAADALGVPGLTRLWPFAPFSFLAWGTFRVFTFWSLRNHSINRLARARFTQSAGITVSQLGLGGAGLASLGLPIGDVLGRAAAASALSRDFAGVPELRKVSFEGLRRTAGQYRRFPLFSAPAQLLVAAGRQLPVVLLAGFYGPVVAGFYALSERVGGAPAQFAGEAIGQAFVAETGPLVETTPDRIEPLFVRLETRLALLGALAFTPLVAGPWLFQVAFGSEWRTAGEYAQLLALLFFARLVVTPAAQILPIVGYQHWHLMWGLGRAVVTLGAIAFAGSAGYSVTTAILAYSISATVFFGLLFVAALVAVRRRAEGAPGTVL